MTPEIFTKALNKLEIEWIRQGLTLDQIQSCEEDALELCHGENYRGSIYYLRTLSRLVNSKMVN